VIEGACGIHRDEHFRGKILLVAGQTDWLGSSGSGPERNAQPFLHAAAELSG